VAMRLSTVDATKSNSSRWGMVSMGSLRLIEVSYFQVVVG
jgi:hypothetical protein